MTRMAAIEIKKLIEKCLKERIVNIGLKFEKISDDDDLYELGAIDSYDVVDILSQIEKETGIAAQFDESGQDNFVLSINWFMSAFSEQKVD